MLDFSILVMIGLAIGWVLALSLAYAVLELNHTGAVMLLIVLLFVWLSTSTLAAATAGFTNVAPERYYGPGVGGFRGNVVERVP